ncbi:MAG: hypothetical protein J2P43_03575 [Candidatus Dormibacteraeota bacterium]|nr:hypothetical protein [Candidatus Dormibacteraeota bacterium]
MRSHWTFTPSVELATREPPLSDPAQLEPLREMLEEIGSETDEVQRFLKEEWPDMLTRRNDPDAEYCGDSICFRVSGDEVIFTPLYEQWGDATFVYVPLADVQDLIDQYAAFIRSR